MLFIEIFLSIHGLLLVSSWLIGGNWLSKQPSLKLKLARFLLVSCIISPLIVHCINYNQILTRHHYASIDALQEYVKQPLKITPLSQANFPTKMAFAVDNISYLQLFYALFGSFIVWRGYRVLVSLNRLKALLMKAILYRTAGKLVIKVSNDCHIPFSVTFFNQAYIVLPLSLLASTKNVKIAIAHEGQHHRQGDCLWVYLTEILRIMFWGNAGVTRWLRILNELQEYSCDEAVVLQPKISAHAYGRCLVDVVQNVSQSALPAKQNIACTVGMALHKNHEDRAFIIRRILMLSAYPHKPTKPLLLGTVFLSCSMLAPLCIAYAAVGSLAGSKIKEIDMTHLNPKMQHTAEQEIKLAVNQYHAKSGVIAIVDPKTGAVVVFAEAHNKQNQISWKTRVFSPGSTIKPFIAAAAIDSGHSSATKSYDCHAPYSVDGKTFTDYYLNKEPITLTEAMMRSSNVCLIKVAQDTGLPLIRKKLTEFGFDMTTWWQTNQSDAVQLAMASIGENIPVTIDSLAKSYAILANQGYSFQGKTPLVSTKTMTAINHILEHVVINGTAKQAAIPGIRIAGKTGTVIENTNGAQGEQLALFAGYLTINTQPYAMVVIIEDGHIIKNGKTLISGGELAAPVFRNMVMNSINATKI